MDLALSTSGPEQPRRIPVFLACPSDLLSEREIFFDRLPQLGDSAVRFTPTGYEIIAATTGERPQDVINRLVDECEVFILVLHRRWGQPAVDSIGATSYTEEEFTRALQRYNASSRPAIICFFKNVGIQSLADPGVQFAKVLEFRKRLESSGKVLYRTFNSETEFSLELERHLLAYASAQLEDPRPVPKKVLLPVPEDSGLDESWRKDIALVKMAVAAASAGHLEDAELMFAQLSQTTVTVMVLETAKQFFDAIGNHDAAQSVTDRKLALLRDRRLAAQEYIASTAAYGWVEEMISARLEITPVKDREATATLLRKLFGPRFYELMTDVLAENFTLGELRLLARFYSGEGGSVSNKMGEFMGRVLPPFLNELQSGLKDVTVSQK